VAETKAEKQRRQARERKQRQREREEALGVRNVWYRMALAEREAISRGAQGAGYEDEAEYLLDLVDRDLSRQGLRRLKA
jgi:hypothetical protein